MAEWTMTCYDGRQFTLPTPLAWDLEYGLGSPCDSFWVKCLFAGGQEALLADGTRMTVTEDGCVVFTGVVDECVCSWSAAGSTVEISGRGLQALLLDNQAEAADFGQATLGEILRRYVTPYGVALEQSVSLPGVWGFSVSSGSSCWKVLYDFVRYYAGVTPRFNRTGQLVLTPWPKQEPVELDMDAPVTRLVWKEKRYGVLSQVTVKDVRGWNRQTEVNADFQRRGGQCSRVILLPRNTGYQARRYNARFQLSRSAAEQRQVEVTLALPFATWPGDLVRLKRDEWGQDGLYRVQESHVTQNETGTETTLLLGDPDAVL